MAEVKKVKKEKSYIDSVHFAGRLWSIGALLVLFTVPVAISAYYDVWPLAKDLFSALKSIILVYWVSSIAEVIAFTPMLGAGGSYLSFVTGNITNLKLPCSLNTMQKAKTNVNTEEGEILSTISVAASAITTTVVIAVGVIILNPIFGKIQESPVVVHVFPYVTSALFGALAASYLRRYWKIAIAPILVGVLVLAFAPDFGVGMLVLITIIVSIGGAFLLNKLKLIK